MHYNTAMDAPDYTLLRPEGTASVVLLCDHASCVVPAALGTLGLTPAQLREHIGWDPGAAALTERLSRALDAPAVLSAVSRLVIDCNRPLDVASSIPVVTGGVHVPGNENLDAATRRARAAAYFHPYHDAITALLDARRAAQRRSAVLAVHSFTPELYGVARPWHAGMVYGRDARFARALGAALAARDETLVLGDNEPYRVTPGSDYSVPVHGEARGLPVLLLEVRNDQLADEAGLARWSTLLTDALGAVVPTLFAP